MNDTLKVAGRIGAELGAAKAENERLRGLLQQVVDCQAEHYGDGCGLHLSMITLAVRIKDALSQQADPTDTYTAVDMATAAAQGFRDGQAAVEQAAAQDERETVSHDAELYGIGFMVDGVRVSPDRVTIQYGRSAQTEQQPIRLPQRKNLDGLLDPESKRAGRAYNEALEDVELLNAAPIAQTAPQPEPSGLSLPRTRLERIERRLTDWLELNCCECESGHSCGRNEVTADRDAIRAALSAQGESHE